MHRILILVVLLAGCATQPVAPSIEAEAKEPLLCRDKAQCDLYWQRAQVWIATNSKYRIQSVTDTVLTTHGPIEHDTQFAYHLEREPSETGGGKITIRMICGNMFGCGQRQYPTAIAFKKYVRGN